MKQESVFNYPMRPWFKRGHPEIGGVCHQQGIRNECCECRWRVTFTGGK